MWGASGCGGATVCGGLDFWGPSVWGGATCNFGFWGASVSELFNSLLPVGQPFHFLMHSKLD